MKKIIFFSLLTVLVSQNSNSSIVVPSRIVNVFFSFIPNYNGCCSAWRITVDQGIGINTTFSDIWLRGFNNNSDCSNYSSYTSTGATYFGSMPLITFKNISLGSTVQVSKMPASVNSWKLMPSWVLVNGVEFSDGSSVLLDNGTILVLHINDQGCQTI
jgi:hypothetical protein